QSARRSATRRRRQAATRNGRAHARKARAAERSEARSRAGATRRARVPAKHARRTAPARAPLGPHRSLSHVRSRTPLTAVPGEAPGNAFSPPSAGGTGRSGETSRIALSFLLRKKGTECASSVKRAAPHRVSLFALKKIKPPARDGSAVARH